MAAAAPLDVNTVVFLPQQLERVVAFMRTVDARLDALERTTHHLLQQQERLTKQLDRQRPPVAEQPGSEGGVCPLCGVFFNNSPELQRHAQLCLEIREQRSGGVSASKPESGLFGRFKKQQH